jgi:hypothetical protein
MVRLQDIYGLWRRTLIAWPDGRRDTKTAVCWLQGPDQYADLRIPPGRPPRRGIGCLRDLDPTMLDFMTQQEGFFGRLDLVQSIGEWHRAFDYQPDAGTRDRGALCFDRGMLIERGIDLPYVEHWQRAAAVDDVMSVRLGGEAPQCRGCLVVAGDAFIYGRGRSAGLPGGASLHQRIAESRSVEAAQNLFDCEISFGHRYGAAWRIERSTLCFREGNSLAPALDDGATVLFVDDVGPTGSAIRRPWRIEEFASTTAAPLRRWLEAECHATPNAGCDTRTVANPGSAA